MSSGLQGFKNLCIWGDLQENLETNARHTIINYKTVNDAKITSDTHKIVKHIKFKWSVVMIVTGTHSGESVFTYEQHTMPKEMLADDIQHHCSVELKRIAESFTDDGIEVSNMLTMSLPEYTEIDDNIIFKLLDYKKGW